ncbi:hypothetical protein BANRA_03860 [Acinetobacter baumannii]|nr:hypothetical protein BANRA_03860 [Acinetobacter baumannii]
MKIVNSIKNDTYDLFIESVCKKNEALIQLHIKLKQIKRYQILQLHP